MRQISLAAAVAGLALLASTPSFAGGMGGPITDNPVATQGVAANWNDPAHVLAGTTAEDEPTVSAAALTGGAPSDPTDANHAGRFTWTSAGSVSAPVALSRSVNGAQPAQQND